MSQSYKPGIAFLLERAFFCRSVFEWFKIGYFPSVYRKARKEHEDAVFLAPMPGMFHVIASPLGRSNPRFVGRLLRRVPPSSHSLLSGTVSQRHEIVISMLDTLPFCICDLHALRAVRDRKKVDCTNFLLGSWRFPMRKINFPYRESGVSY